MENLKELNKALRKHLKQNGLSGLGWKVSYTGTVLCATCAQYEVQFTEVMLARKFIEANWPIENAKAHFSDNTTFVAIINWIH